MSKTDIRQRGNRHPPILRGYSLAMSALLTQPRSWISRWRGMRLIVMPAVIVGVGLWISSVQSRSADYESDRVGLFLRQVLEESARDPSQFSNAMSASDPLLVEEFRGRLQRAARESRHHVPRVVVRVGDFGAGAVGSASHTATACYEDGAQIAVRVIARPGDAHVRLVGVFTPQAADFASPTEGAK